MFPQIVSKRQESVTEVRYVDARFYSVFNTGGKRLPEAVLNTIRTRGCVRHLSAKGIELFTGEGAGLMYGGRDAGIAVSDFSKERGLRNFSQIR